MAKDEESTGDWTDTEVAAYRAWMFTPDPDGNEEPGEAWEIQERAWLAGYRAGELAAKNV